MRVRPPAVAGLFYPADPSELRRAVADAVADARRSPPGTPAAKALVAPHAGYVYSGAIAASAYLRATPARDLIRRVVVLGPAHRVAVRGIAVPTVDAFATPLGEVPIDAERRRRALELPSVVADDGPHRPEHCIEVHLPFLQTLLDPVEILPLLVGSADPGDVVPVLDAVWGGPETLIVVSTDLSHYHAHREARQLDAATAAAIVARRDEAIGDGAACGSRPLRALLRVAAREDLDVEQLDLRNSGDTAGDPERVVGYGAFAVR